MCCVAFDYHNINNICTLFPRLPSCCSGRWLLHPPSGRPGRWWQQVDQTQVGRSRQKPLMEVFKCYFQGRMIGSDPIRLMWSPAKADTWIAKAREKQEAERLRKRRRRWRASRVGNSLKFKLKQGGKLLKVWPEWQQGVFEPHTNGLWTRRHLGLLWAQFKGTHEAKV